MNVDMSKVNSPSHYGRGKIEVAVAMDCLMAPNHGLGHALKYACRAPHKGNEAEDVQKALWWVRHALAIDPRVEWSAPPHARASLADALVAGLPADRVALREFVVELVQCDLSRTPTDAYCWHPLNGAAAALERAYKAIAEESAKAKPAAQAKAASEHPLCPLCNFHSPTVKPRLGPVPDCCDTCYRDMTQTKGADLAGLAQREHAASEPTRLTTRDIGFRVGDRVVLSEWGKSEARKYPCYADLLPSLTSDFVVTAVIPEARPNGAVQIGNKPGDWAVGWFVKESERPTKPVEFGRDDGWAAKLLGFSDDEPARYTIEPHGPAGSFVLYHGRGPNRHGMNLCTISELDWSSKESGLLDRIVAALNEPAEFVLRPHVQAFMAAAGQAMPASPCVPAAEVVRLRLRLIAEEFFELLDSVTHDSPYICDARTLTFKAIERVVPECVEMVAFVDALADIDYVVSGSYLAFGIEAESVHAEVCRSNESKLVNGKMQLDAGGKAQKGPDYSPPDIAGVLRKQGWQG